jgi:adenylate cyclase, class 2
VFYYYRGHDYQMPKNLELKAKFPNIKRAESIARRISGSDGTTIHQTDTYFKVSAGRLKLRVIKGQQSELIWYDRDETSGEMLSSYERVKIPADGALPGILQSALSVDVTIEKDRTVYLWNNCRIHIDMVENLGPYLEFEVILEGDDAGEERMQYLREQFGITELDIVDCSYSDLMRTQIMNY